MPWSAGLRFTTFIRLSELTRKYMTWDKFTNFCSSYVDTYWKLTCIFFYFLWHWMWLKIGKNVLSECLTFRPRLAKKYFYGAWDSVKKVGENVGTQLCSVILTMPQLHKPKCLVVSRGVQEFIILRKYSGRSQYRCSISVKYLWRKLAETSHHTAVITNLFSSHFSSFYSWVVHHYQAHFTKVTMQWSTSFLTKRCTFEDDALTK